MIGYKYSIEYQFITENIYMFLAQVMVLSDIVFVKFKTLEYPLVKYFKSILRPVSTTGLIYRKV